MTDMDPRLVRLVSRHFIDLQGYCRVLAGIAIATPGFVYVITRSNLLGATAMFCAFATLFMPMRAAQRYYHTRFGRVEQGATTYRVTILVVVAMSVLLLPHGIELYWSLIALQGLWLVVDGWPYRSHMLGQVAAATVAALAAPSGSATIQALMPGAALYGTAAILCGFADHALLVRAMGVTGREEQVGQTLP